MVSKARFLPICLCGSHRSPPTVVQPTNSLERADYILVIFHHQLKKGSDLQSTENSASCILHWSPSSCLVINTSNCAECIV